MTPDGRCVQVDAHGMLVYQHRLPLHFAVRSKMHSSRVTSAYSGFQRPMFGAVVKISISTIGFVSRTVMFVDLSRHRRTCFTNLKRLI